MNYDELLSESDAIQAELECVLPITGNECVERAVELAVYLARTGEMLAHAKKLYRAKKSSQISETIIKIAKENFLSSRAQNALVDSIAEEEAFLVERIERQNRCIVHDIDIIRSIISKEKTELQYLNTRG